MWEMIRARQRKERFTNVTSSFNDVARDWKELSKSVRWTNKKRDVVETTVQLVSSILNMSMTKVNVAGVSVASTSSTSLLSKDDTYCMRRVLENQLEAVQDSSAIKNRTKSEGEYKDRRLVAALSEQLNKIYEISDHSNHSKGTSLNLGNF